MIEPDPGNPSGAPVPYVYQAVEFVQSWIQLGPEGIGEVGKEAEGRNMGLWFMSKSRRFQPYPSTQTDTSRLDRRW